MDEKTRQPAGEAKAVKKKPDKKAKDDGKSFFKEKYYEFKAEFKKIVWPSRKDLIKQTVTVVVISLLFGAYIAALDGAFSQVFSQFVRFIG